MDDPKAIIETILLDKSMAHLFNMRPTFMQTLFEKEESLSILMEYNSLQITWFLVTSFKKRD